MGRHRQTTDRRGVGLLLYLIKFLRSDISNAVREPSKVMDGATLGNMKSMLKKLNMCWVQRFGYSSMAQVNRKGANGCSNLSVTVIGQDERMIEEVSQNI